MAHRRRASRPECDSDSPAAAASSTLISPAISGAIGASRRNAGRRARTTPGDDCDVGADRFELAVDETPRARRSARRRRPRRGRSRASDRRSEGGQSQRRCRPSPAAPGGRHMAPVRTCRARRARRSTKLRAIERDAYRVARGPHLGCRHTIANVDELRVGARLISRIAMPSRCRDRRP